MRTYDIDCKCQIVLYGFNNYTQKQISEIKEQGYFCGGIIDRRAQEIKMYQDIPVVSDIRELRQSKDACVFIMLQNALNHMEVAETLYRQGIKKILFVPMKCNAASQKIRIQLIEKYNMMQGCQYNLLRKIPYVQADFLKKSRTGLQSCERRGRSGNCMGFCRKNIYNDTGTGRICRYSTCIVYPVHSAVFLFSGEGKYRYYRICFSVWNLIFERKCKGNGDCRKT